MAEIFHSGFDTVVFGGNDPDPEDLFYTSQQKITGKAVVDQFMLLYFFEECGSNVIDVGS